ncbi:MAG TPA: hypothetical protein VNK43_05020 [Gemmatimonadales bacterium]|nr:hypothetical protein [Gemmatimonadales bacterium]
MCYFISLASPLTLSEVRAMLPAGLTADPLDPSEQRLVRALHPDAPTAARILHGGCSCDLVVDRKPVPREDEAHLRARYRALGCPRELVIRALERHRRGAEARRRPPGYWGEAFRRFVAEHARNAGRTLYLLRFSPDGRLGPLAAVEPSELPLPIVLSAPERWLPEDHPVVVA